jgi:hypothetical protein
LFFYRKTESTKRLLAKCLPYYIYPVKETTVSISFLIKLVNSSINYLFMKYSFFLFFILCLSFLSCDKDDSAKEPTKTELVTQASWKYDNAGLDIDKNGSIDLAGTLFLQPCMTDFTLTLKSDGTGTMDEGPTKCDATDPQSEAITWSFANNETVLNIGSASLFGVSGQIKILELSATKLTLSIDTTLPPNIIPLVSGPVALVATLKH